MSWTHYSLCYRLLSPLHVGYRRVGNLMQTRPYVPGKPLWAALTARLTRDRERDPSVLLRPEDYGCVGNLVKERFRFGYLWPSLDGERPCFFWDHEGFEHTFLGSYVSTALDYGRRAAEEGSLHEIEFLAPYTREEGYPVHLVGDLWVQEDSLPEELRSWREALGKIQLGGERSYGWGRVRLLSSFEKAKPSAGRTVTGFRWEVQNDEVVLRLPKDEPLPAHALAAGAGAGDGDGDRPLPAGSVRGAVETLSGWQRALEDSSKTWELMEVQLAYAPGARVQRALTLVVDPWGRLTHPQSST